LQAIWPYSGHYHPTEENFREFVSFLEEHNVDLSNVKVNFYLTNKIVNKKIIKLWLWNKLTNLFFLFNSFQRYAIDDDAPSFIGTNSFINNNESQQILCPTQSTQSIATNNTNKGIKDNNATQVKDKKYEGPIFDFSKRLSCKWSTGAGPRIGCVRDYPEHLQSRALEQVNLSPRPASARPYSYGPIPSPRPSPKVRISPRLAYMGLPSPRTPIHAN
jgi:hypothetical protein